MENNKKISQNQALSILFLSVVLLPFAASRAMLTGKSSINISFSMLLCVFFVFILIKPVYSSKEKIKENFGLCFLYLLYFLFMGIYNLSVFLVFVSNVISPEIKISVIALAICLVALYASFKGIETVARSSVIALFMIFISVLILVFASGFEIKAENIKLNEFSFCQTFESAAEFFSRTFIIPAGVFLFSFTDEIRKKNVFLWSAATFSLLFILIIVSVGRLGSYFDTQLFPIYRLSEIVSIGPFTKGEIFFLGAFLIGLTMEVSVILILCGKCISCFSKKENGKYCSAFLVSVVWTFSVLVSKNVKLQHYVFSRGFLLILAISFSIVIPITFSLKSKKIIPILLSLVLLTGCSESKIQDKMMVSGIYIEKEKDIFNVALIASHSKENEYYEGQGNSIKEAISVLQSRCGKKAVFSYDMLVFLGENIAKENIDDTLDFFIRYYEILPSSKIIYTTVSKTEFEKNSNAVIKEVSAIIKNKNIKKTDIVELTNSYLDKNGDFALPVFEKDEEKINLSKIAIYKDSKIHCILNEEISKDYLLYLNEIKNDTVIIKNKDFGKVTLSLTNIKAKNSENDFVLSCDADISECETFENILFSYEQYETFEEELTSVLNKKIQAVIKSTACKNKNIIINANVNKMEEEANPLF